MEATATQVQRKLELLTKWQLQRDSTLNREWSELCEEICQSIADWLEVYEVPYRYDKEQRRYVEVAG